MLSGRKVRPVPPPDATEKYFLPFSTHSSYMYLLPMLEMGRVGGVTANGNVYASFST